MNWIEILYTNRLKISVNKRVVCKYLVIVDDNACEWEPCKASALIPNKKNKVYRLLVNALLFFSYASSLTCTNSIKNVLWPNDGFHYRTHFSISSNYQHETFIQRTMWRVTLCHASTSSGFTGVQSVLKTFITCSPTTLPI